MINLLINVISDSISILFASHILKTKGWSMKEVIYGCIKGLDGRMPDWKLGMHAKCFNEIVAGRMMVAIDWADSKAVAITTLEICVFTQMVHGGSWKVLQPNRNGNNPDGCILCLKSFFVGCVLTLKKGNDCIVCSSRYNSFSSLHFVILIHFLMGFWFVLNCLFFSKQMTQALWYM